MWGKTPIIHHQTSHTPKPTLGSSPNLQIHQIISGFPCFCIPGDDPSRKWLQKGKFRSTGSIKAPDLSVKLLRKGVMVLRWQNRFRMGARKRDNEGSSFKRKAASERSDRANEELLLFFFQLDLTTRLQRALNQDQYEIAQQLREKIAEVDREILRQREGKMGSSSKDEAQDKELAILRLKTELQHAVEVEDYAGAADLRDKISQFEAESLAASARALAHKNVRYLFRLGQKVRHKDFGYRGVVCGMDPLCCESEDWMHTAKFHHFVNGRNQPFYQVLVDVQQEPSLMVAYVAEEKLDAFVEPDLERFDHPYVYFLFYGSDSAGDLIPTKQLREKYDAPRHELPWKGDGKDGSSGG